MKEGYVAPPALWSGKLVDEIFSQPPKAKENLQLLKQNLTRYTRVQWAMASGI
jgi:hypothetical protein